MKKTYYIIEKVYTSLNHLIGCDIKTHTKVEDVIRILDVGNKTTKLTLSNGREITTNKDVTLKEPKNSHEVSELMFFPFLVDLTADISVPKNLKDGYDIPTIKGASLVVNEGNYDRYMKDDEFYTCAINNWIPTAIRHRDDVSFDFNEIYDFICKYDNESMFREMYERGADDTNEVISEMVSYYRDNFLRIAGVSLKQFLVYTEFLNPTEKVRYDEVYRVFDGGSWVLAKLKETRNMFDCIFESDDTEIKNISVFDILTENHTQVLNKATELNKALKRFK